MRVVFVAVSAFLILACGAQKKASNLENLQDSITVGMRNGIDDGNCELSLVPNATLVLKKDAFDRWYGEVSKSELTLVKLSYKREVPKGVADAEYSETYYFSVPKSTSTLDLVDDELQTVNLVVERRCFCKGTAGFFKIISGNLNLSIKKNELTLSGNFSHEHLPLLMTKIDEKVSLEP